MKLWGYITSLFFVLLSMIVPSKGGCRDNLDLNSKKWEGKLTKNISLIKLDNLRDMTECTLEEACRKEKSFCVLLNDCFYSPERDFKTPSEKCRGGVSSESSEVYFFHLICMVANADNYDLTGCRGYETICSPHSETTPSQKYGETSSSPTTGALPNTTTTTVIPLSTTTLPETTANPAALLMTTTLQPISTTKAAPQVTSTNADGNSSGHESVKEGNFNLNILLMVSLMLNVVLPVLVYFYMRRQNRKQRMSANINNEVNEASIPPTNMELKECANGRDVEAYLLQTVQPFSNSSSTALNEDHV